MAGKELIEGEVGREVWSLRGGPGWDYPCADPMMKECAMYECQRQARCRKASDSKD